MSTDRLLPTRPYLRDEIIAILRELIDRQRCDRLVRIEAERELAARLSVSRLSLRAAVKTLVDEGLLLRKRGSGTYIVPVPASQIVDLIAAPDIKPQDPFYSEFLSELSRYLAEQSLHLRMLHPAQLPAASTSNPLIIVGLIEDRLIRSLRATHGRVIATQSYPDAVEISQICFDDYQIGVEAASILFDRGHRRIAHLAGPAIYPSALKRCQGFTDRLKALGVEPDVIEGKMNWESGYELGEDAITLSTGRKPVTAIFAANDWMALGLMQRLREEGVSVPERVSVLGCDDIHLAWQVKPHLSTFKWDVNYLIREMFTFMESMNANGPTLHKKILLPARFVERDSLKRIVT
ncbi:MAG TPA: substrate-binding domain-containing protein [Spirochaetia bacterium]|nr:substrate-binding domain-containing protein [Spirochaetia bacterium]